VYNVRYGTLVKSIIKKIRRREQGGCRCKMAGTGFHSVVTNRDQMCTAYNGMSRYSDRGLPRRKKSYRGLPQRKYLYRGLPQSRSLNLSADCQGGIPVVANRGIWARFATKDWNPVPAILHWQSHLFEELFIFDARTWQELNQYAANCLGLNYILIVSVGHTRVSVPVGHTISWHYTF
jgi:hypothetical protein